ncbi:MAG: cysteine desulfurase NifS [Verrucomicrobiales bacterium]|nr:cysteine desulfurase NifS [Verrucomicrobiales bacterium]MCP5526740.1 cysteine desulfurase NifS [Verrucomicrobiales bacterium]
MSDRPIIYFDHNATTRVAPEVLAAMQPFFERLWGNPSSAYGFGRAVTSHLDEAREKVAALIHAEPREIVFTSCGTESNNTAIASALRVAPEKRHVVTTAVEHSANLAFGRDLERRGHEVTFLPVQPDGSLDLGRLQQALRPDTALCSVMLANNETGVLFPVAEIAALCRSHGVPFHTDAVQAAGKLKVDVGEIGCDMLSLSAHKLHAPKGIGLLYVRRRCRFHPYILGGHQERGRRGGTENVPYIVGFGRAAELAQARLRDRPGQVRALRDRLENGLQQAVPGVHRNGGTQPRLPNTANLAFDGVEAEAMLLLLDRLGLCASSGSACTTGALEPSHVLSAMGLEPMRARGSIRFSLGPDNTDAEVDYALQHIPEVVRNLRAISPLAPGPAERPAADP